MEENTSTPDSSYVFVSLKKFFSQNANPDLNQLKVLFTDLASIFATPAFIQNDPIWVPHQFQCSEDIEISAFLTALIAWGKRPLIIRFAWHWMHLMDYAPYDFFLNANEKDLSIMRSFYYRTLSGEDIYRLTYQLWLLYQQGETLQTFAKNSIQQGGIPAFFNQLRNHFGVTPNLLSLFPLYGKATGKRLHLFLRWMVRKDHIDFGLWNSFIASHQLYIPMDTHVHRLSLKFRLIHRKTLDWKAVCLLTHLLRSWKPDDPIFYDFAFIGLGTIKGFYKNLIFE